MKQKKEASLSNTIVGILIVVAIVGSYLLGSRTNRIEAHDPAHCDTQAGDLVLELKANTTYQISNRTYASCDALQECVDSIQPTQCRENLEEKHVELLELIQYVEAIQPLMLDIGTFEVSKKYKVDAEGKKKESLVIQLNKIEDNRYVSFRYEMQHSHGFIPRNLVHAINVATTYKHLWEIENERN